MNARILSSRASRLLCLALLLIVTLESTSFVAAYLKAYRYLKERDLPNTANLSGTLVFCRPKQVTVNQQLTREDLVRHLASIGYAQQVGNEPGTFNVTGNAMNINSRLPEFPDAIITFSRSRVSAITINGRPAQQIEIEPEPLINFIRLVRDDVARTMRVRRIVLQPSQLIPSAAYDATRAIEDHRYETHNGVDEIGVVSAMLSGRGGSTITQQWAKNEILHDQTRSLTRKLKELPLALAAERQMSKSEIFTAYANAIYFGSVQGGPCLYGFAAASAEFFGTADVQNLSLGCAAALAGMVHGPEPYLRAARRGDYGPLLTRRAVVLASMHRYFPEKYSEQVIAAANAESLEFVFASDNQEERPLDMDSRAFQDYAASQAYKLTGLTEEEANLHLYTTLDPELQVVGSTAVSAQLSTLDLLVRAAARKQRIDPASIEPIQSALVAMDAQSGEVLAMVGGRNTQFNYAMSKRSPGSAIKPFVYLQGIAQGRHNGTPFTAATEIDPAQDQVDNYRPSGHIGRPGLARTLLARSDNGGAVVAAHDAGLNAVRELISRVTGSYSEDLTGMLAIGGSAGSEVDLLSLVEGYSVFPNGGSKASHTIFSAVYKNRVKVDMPRSQPVRIVDAGAAYVLCEMLRSVLQPGGTARSALADAGLSTRTNVAGKTGTGQVADCWFIGFSRRLIVGVWVGMPRNRPALRVADGFDGARAAGPIWSSFIRAVAVHRPDLLEGEFGRPPNVMVRRIDPAHGCVTVGPGIDEYFIRGREPAACPER